MSGLEISILIMACVLPLASFIFIKPKKKKKDKAEQVENKKEEVKIEQKPQPIIKEEPKINEESNEDSFDKDIQSYVEYKKKNTTKPKRVDMPPSFKDMSMPYVPRRRIVEKKPQTIADEINSLSPELKAMLIAGILDKKNYDN